MSTPAERRALIEKEEDDRRRPAVIFLLCCCCLLVIGISIGVGIGQNGGGENESGPGACCSTSGDCDDALTNVTCADISGVFQGESSTCDATHCSTCDCDEIEFSVITSFADCEGEYLLSEYVIQYTDNRASGCAPVNIATTTTTTQCENDDESCNNNLGAITYEDEFVCMQSSTVVSCTGTIPMSTGIITTQTIVSGFVLAVEALAINTDVYITSNDFEDCHYTIIEQIPIPSTPCPPSSPQMEV